MHSRILIALILFSFLGFGQTIDLNTRKAFPSLQGLGAEDIYGGRGGKVMYVTSLSSDPSVGSYDAGTDTYSGSLNYLLRLSDPGYIIFRVSGVIVATADSWQVNGGGYKTVMGGTAPYPGVVFWNNRWKLYLSSNNTGNFNQQWVVRGLTFLGGTISNIGQDDAIQIQDATQFVLSDNTFGWAGDEAYSIDDANQFIAQRNMAIECAPDHNTGSIFKTDIAVVQPGRTLSAHDNGYFHIKHRFPNFRALEDDFAESINNVVFNYQTRFESHNMGLRLNDINNYYKPGVRSASGYLQKKKWNAGDIGTPQNWSEILIHTSGNIVEGEFDNPSADNEPLWGQHVTANGYTSGTALGSAFFSATPFPLGTDIVIRTAADAWTYNVTNKNIGARFYTDANGVRQKYYHPFVEGYLNDAINGTDLARLNDNTLFTQPTLPSSGSAYADTDSDGMADAWETTHGLSVGTDDKESVKATWTIDGATFNNNAGFTNMEMFNDYVHGGFVRMIDDLGGIVNATSVAVTPTTATIDAGETTQLAATFTPSNTSDKSGVWSSSNEAAATVNTSGVVTGVSSGSATITFTSNDGSFTDTSAITVNAGTVSVTSVSVSPSFGGGVVGTTEQLTETVLPANAADKTGTWSTSDALVATVNSSGLVTRVGAGTCTITFTATDTTNGTLSDTYVETTTATVIPVTGISFNFNTANVTVGSVYVPSYTITPSNATNKGVIFTTDNPGVFTEQGLAILPNTATYTIEAQDKTNGTFTDTMVITVVAGSARKPKSKLKEIWNN